MNSAPTTVCDLLANLPWNAIGEGLKIAVSLTLAGCALCALKTWKRQLTANKKLEFLDELTEKTHELIQKLSTPLFLVRMAKVGIACRIQPCLPNEEAGYYPGVERYIKSQGKTDSTKLIESLKECEPPFLRIGSLIAKGQVLGFDDYSVCKNSLMAINAQYERITAFSALIGMDSVNFRNPHIQSSFTSVTSLDPDEISQIIGRNHEIFLAFVKTAYEGTLK